MIKVREWSGDAHSGDFLTDNRNKELIAFCDKYELIYIFGAGKIGSGMKSYLNQSGIQNCRFVTSDTIAELKSNYIASRVGIVLSVNDKHLEEIVPSLDAFVSSGDIIVMPIDYRENIGNQFSKENIKQNFRIHVYLTSHCNLNCKGCRSFSPINRPDYYRYDEYYKDIEQMKSLGVHLNFVNFTGGEPFLNPDLFDILKVTRATFPGAIIQVFTNGTLLKNISDKDMKLLIELDVTTVITEYPVVKLDYRNIFKEGQKYSVIYSDSKKIFSTPKIALTKEAPKYDFYSCFCYKRSTGLQMWQGKLYQCVIRLFAPYFNEYFGTNLELSDDDYIDIYNTSAEEIYNYKVTRIPFCDYCDSTQKSLFEWDISEKKIQEWT
jgi:organic radical activating enzyme